MQRTKAQTLQNDEVTLVGFPNSHQWEILVDSVNVDR